MKEDDQPRSRIEDVKRHLYDREDTTASRAHAGVLHPVPHKVPASWQTNLNQGSSTSEDMKMKKPGMSGFKKFFISALIFFVGALGYGAYMFITGGISVSSDNIDITVLGNAFTKGGDELPLQIEITNRNNASLELANLIIEYPRGVSDNSADVIRLPRESIGTIKRGQSITRNIKVRLFGDEKSVRNVKISLEYHPEGSNAIFTKVKEYPVTISSAPLSLLIDAPDQTSSNQLVTLKVTATLNTTLPEGNTVLQVTYPNGFIFDSAVPAPQFGNSVWSLSTLSLTNPIPITIKGRLIGQDGDEQVFHVYAGATRPTDQSTVNVIYNSLLKAVTIAKPFLEARIVVSGQDLPSYTANGGETVNAEIYWSNNLSTRVSDAQIIVGFSGNAYNKTAVNSGEGFFDSLNNRIIWDKNTVPELVSIEPGASGSMSFNFKPFSLVGPTKSLKDPQIILNVSIKGRQPSDGSTYNDVNNFTQKIIKILSDFQVASSANYSSGSLPPKAETETKYVVTWSLSNSANSVTQAVARSALPVYIKWVGPQAGSNENISYNSATREVVWNIGTVIPNTGFGSNREVSFVVSLTPSLSQVGSVPQLMKEIILTGTDTFTGTQLQSKRGPITTLLSNDPNFIIGNERVIQ